MTGDVGGNVGWRLTHSISNPASSDRLLGAAVAVAAGAEEPLPDGVNDVLDCATYPALIVADVLHEAEGTAGLKEALDLGQGAGGVVSDVAEDETADGCIEGRVLEG